MTLQEIDEMVIIEPYCFENEQEEQWYKVGLREGADAAIKQLGWHPASELPELNEYGNSELVYALYGTNNSRLSPIISCVIEGKWHDDNIKWWCYPPEEG